MGHWIREARILCRLYFELKWPRLETISNEGLLL